MYKLLFPFSFLIISLLYNSPSFQQPIWEIKPSPTNKDFKNCFFLDNNYGWISGDSGTIIHTSNGGANWVIQNTDITKDIKSLFFINERLGWAVALQLNFDTIPFAGTIILKTSDGGNNWIQSMYPDTNVFMSSIYFLDSLNGFLGGAPKFIQYTNNGGVNWNQAISDSAIFNGVPVEKILFYNNQIGYASGGSRDFVGSVWTTTNSGLNWKQKIIGVDPITDLFMVNQDSVFGTGGDFKFGANYFTTANFGQSWQAYNLGFAGIATAIDFRTPTEGWIALGNSELFFYTLNGGVNWTMTKTPDSSAIFDITFTDSLNGWAVGKNGVILKYNPIMVSSSTNQNNVIDDNFSLYQNYPNPFNPNTVISYQLAVRSDVSINVYDALGKVVVELINEKQNAGLHSIEFDGSNLPSGIYFYELKAGNNFKVKRMLLLK